MSRLLEQMLKTISEPKAHPFLQVEQETIGAPAAPDMIDRLVLRRKGLNKEEPVPALFR